MNNNSPNLNSFCRSIGLIYDRTSSGADPIGSVFMVAEKKVATLASLLLPYSAVPESLRVVFPSTERECGVGRIHLHPKFDSGLTRKTALQGTLGNGPEAALQKYNCSILELVDKLPELSKTQIEQVSEALRFPLNLTDEGFRGSLAEIELPLVIQTLNNAKKQGTLYICDELHRPLAQIFCQGGRILAAKYRTLTNELAIFQIVEKRLTGRFVFRASKAPMWMPEQTITRSTDTLLIEAMRRQDEITNLQKQLGTSDYFFVRAYKQLYMDGVSTDNRKAAELIWRALDGTTPAEELWNLVPLDDYTILAALNEMYASNQCMRVPLAGTMQFNIPKMPDDSYAPAFLQSIPLPLGTQLPLNAFDTISSVAIDPANSKPRVKVGALLGAIDPYDANHLLHDIPLLPWASGSPIIKDDLVIGMHCGVVPNCSAVDNTFGVLQQMLWCEALEEVLKSIPGTKIPPPEPLRVEPPVVEGAASIAQLASTIPEDFGSISKKLEALDKKVAEAANASVANTNVTAAKAAENQVSSSAKNQAISSAASSASPATGAASSASGAASAAPGQPAATPAAAPTSANSSFTRLPATQKAVDSKEAVERTIIEASNAPTVEVPKVDVRKAQALIDSESPAKPEGLPGCREIASLKCAMCGERTYSNARRCTRCQNEFVPQLKKDAKPASFDFALPVAAGITLLMAASAAFAWTRLPQPVFEDVALMSVPSKPLIELKIIQAIRSNWIARPSGTRFKNLDAIAARVRSNEACYVYLFYKGSGSKKASLLYPSQDSTRNNLSQGDTITAPEQLSVMTANGPAINSFTVGGEPGTDEILAIAANPNALRALEDANNQDPIFEKARNLLAMSKSQSGVLVSASQVMPDAALRSDKPGSSSDNREMLYITSVSVRH